MPAQGREQNSDSMKRRLAPVDRHERLSFTIMTAWSSSRGFSFGTIGVGSYLLGLATPWAWELPLFALALCSVLALRCDSRESLSSQPALRWPVLSVLGATGLSTLTSEDMGRSLRLSIPLFPAVLLFFLIAQSSGGLRSLRRLFVLCSLMSFGLAALLLWTVKRSGATDPSLWVQQMGSPLLLVPNDITFLAVLAPFTFVLLYREPCTRVGVGAALSLLVSLWAICVLQSRVAVLTMITSLLCTAVCIRPRLGLLGGVLFLFLALGIDGLYGFPLVAKWTQVQDARLFLWWAAWAMFRDAPLLGHGPHTFVLRYQSYMPQSPLPAWLPVDTRLVSWAHNLYLETLAEQGIIGAAALGWLLTCGVVAAWKTQRAPPEDVRLFGASALGGLCGICLAAALELSLVRHWVAVTLFLLLGVIARVLALAQQHTDNKKEETT